MAIKGNSLIERHPDYKSIILENFTNLKELDSISINEAVKNQMRIGRNLRREIIPFFYRVDKVIGKVEGELAEA